MTAAPYFLFSFTFVSYIPTNFTVFTRLTRYENPKAKLFLKQSYTLFAWLHYLTQKISIKSSNLKLWTLPTRRQHFTLTKAPMAHKNWSKEQYKTQFYFFKLSIRTIVPSSFLIKSDGALFFLLMSKKALFSFETNLLFLKSFFVICHFNDLSYFNYNSAYLKLL